MQCPKHFMMHHQHQHLRSIASLLIGLFLSGGGNVVVHGFTAPIIRGTATAVGACQFFCPLHSPTARQSLDANSKTPSLKFLHRFSPRILPSSTTPATYAVVALQGEPTNNVDNDSSNNDANEIIARRIIVVGDVDGGYYRSCVKNEASRFRKLIGTISPPANEKRAEIYVEGKRKMVEGFIRWCKRGDVGLSQSIKVDSVIDEFPTGLYDDFYVATGRE